MVRAENVSHQGGQDALSHAVRAMAGSPDAGRDAQSAGQAQRAERARRDRGRHRTGAGGCAPSSRRWRSFGASAARFQRYARYPAKGRRQFTADRRLRPPSGGNAGHAGAARGAFPGRRMVLAFQPHRYTRTRDLFEDFVKVLCGRGRAAAGGSLCRGRGAHRRGGRPDAGARGTRRRARSNPVFVEDIGGYAAAPSARRRRMAMWCSPWARARSAACRLRSPRLATGLRARGERCTWLSKTISPTRRCAAELRADEPMRKHLSWRTGGSADRAYVPGRSAMTLRGFCAPCRRTSRSISSAWAAICWCATAACAAR